MFFLLVLTQVCEHLKREAADALVFQLRQQSDTLWTDPWNLNIWLHKTVFYGSSYYKRRSFNDILKWCLQALSIEPMIYVVFCQHKIDTESNDLFTKSSVLARV